MEEEFWHQRWQNNEIGFHEQQPNRLLVEHFAGAFTEPATRIFLPLCGKTRDIGWLVSQGHRVAGAELSEAAVAQLFADMGLDPEIVRNGGLTIYRADGIDVFAGNIFELNAETLGPVDVVYDRAALVALPADMRTAYAAHMVNLTALASQFLITFEYDQSAMEGPPFSVSAEEVRRCYEAHYRIAHVTGKDVAGGLKGRCAAVENVYLLRPHTE